MLIFRYSRGFAASKNSGSGGGPNEMAFLLFHWNRAIAWKFGMFVTAVVAVYTKSELKHVAFLNVVQRMLEQTIRFFADTVL